MHFLMRSLRDAIAATAFLFVMAGPAPSQWLKLPLPGTPRLPVGKPDLTAAVRKTPDGRPDLSGIWTANSGKYLDNLAGPRAEAPLLPGAEKLYKNLLLLLGKDKRQLH